MKVSLKFIWWFMRSSGNRQTHRQAHTDSDENMVCLQAAGDNKSEHERTSANNSGAPHHLKAQQAFLFHHTTGRLDVEPAPTKTQRTFPPFLRLKSSLI